MPDRAPGTADQACPFVDRDDSRCSNRFSLGRIDQAFCVCFDAFHVCPMYHQITSEAAQTEVDRRRTALITVTAHGLAVPLRATGT